MTPSAQADAADLPASGADQQRDEWWLVVAAALAVFMASIDMSIVNIALPAIERDFAVPPSLTEWAVLAYLLPLAGLALPTGRWLDTVGRRQALAFSLSGFALTSVAAGMSQSATWLIGARLVQGAFGALLFSLLPALVATAVRPQARGRAMAVVTTIGPLGLISGPALGGLLIDALGWQWIFFVNVPVSIAVATVGLRLLPDGPGLRLPGWSWVGECALLTSAIGAVLLALTFTTSRGAGWLFLALCAVPLIAVWLRSPGSAAVKQLVRAPGTVGPHLALLSAGAAIGVAFFIAPFFAQRELGASASAAGAAVLAFPLGMALAGPVGGLVGDWWGTRRTALLGAAAFTFALVTLIPMDTSWTLPDLAWRLALAGCGNGLFNAPNMALVMTQTPPPLLATTGASTTLARTLGFALGPALATLLWSTDAFGPDGMGRAVAAAAVLSGLSVAALSARDHRVGAVRG